jgi:hypothetical protein
MTQLNLNGQRGLDSVRIAHLFKVFRVSLLAESLMKELCTKGRAATEPNTACAAGDSIEPGVERSETPGS